MHRLFVAIRPPRFVRERLLALMGGVGGARWLEEEQLHLTLRFIGEVDRHLASDIQAALGAVYHPGFEIAVSGLGCFERRGQLTTLWAGVAPQEPLNALHKKIDQALVRAGVEPEGRAFRPHVTLARLKSHSGPVAPFLEGAGGFASPPFTVTNFSLLESQLAPEGPLYELVERYSLG